MMQKCITIKDYKLFKLIGKGSFGEVYLTKKENYPKILATKRIDLNSDKTQNMAKYLNYEITIMKELDHPNIIKLIEFIQSKNHIYVVMEYCNGGMLSECLKKSGGTFPVKIIQYIMRQIVEALKYIHSKNIIHRDIKLDNILVNFKKKEDLLNNNLLEAQIKIIDFGLAIRLGPTKKYTDTFIGSPIHMDPHILGVFDENGKMGELQKYNEKADIWSLGSICYEMFTGKTLFKAQNIKQLAQKAKLGDYSIPINVELSNEIISFLNSMLQYNAEERLSAEELSFHPFLIKDVSEFTMVDLNALSNKIENNEIKLNSWHNKTIVRIVNKKINQNKESPIDESIPYYPSYTQNNHIINKQKQNNFLPSNNHNQHHEYKDDELREYERISNLLIGIKNYEEKKEKQNILKSQQINQNNNSDKLKYINGILFEYIEANNYFKENNLKSQKQDAYSKIIEIEKAKKLIESGNSTTNIMPPINPEYIYGCSTKERNDKFIEIINKYKSEQSKLSAHINSNGKYPNKNNANQQLEIIKLNKLNFIINELENKSKNIWTPAPEYIKETKKVNVEKISYTNCDFNLKIQVNKIDNKNENINFVVYLKINEIKKYSKEIKFINQGNCYDEWIWTLNFNEWKNVDNNSDPFIIGVETYNNYSNRNNLYSNISKIINGQMYSINVNIPTQSNNTITINLLIIPILPAGNKFSVIETKNFITINKIFPAFKGKYPNLPLISF